MSSAKRPYNETISSNSSSSNNNDYIVNVVVEEQQQEAEQDMDIEEQIPKVEETFASSSRRRKLNTDNDASDHLFQSSPPIFSTRNTLTYSLNNTVSNSIAPSSKNSASFPLSDVEYISPRVSFTFDNNSSKSTLKVSEDTKELLTPVDLLMSSPPISTSTPKINQTRNTSNSSLTLTTQNPDTWDFNYTDSSYNNDSNLWSRANNKDSPDNNINQSSNNSNIADVLSSTANIRTKLKLDESKGPFSPIYSQIYDNEGIVIASESFNYLIQLYEFCDNSSTKLQSNITSILRDLVLLLNSQLDNFDIPFIEHHKWNGSHFYGPIDVVSLLDDLDDGLGLSSAEYISYNCNRFTQSGGSVLQCGCRRTYRPISPISPPASLSASSSTRLQDNELRHAVLDRDAEREAQNFLDLLAEEEENEIEDNEDSTEQEEESDSFTEISKESDDDDDSLIQGFVSTSIRQRVDTFGNPTNQTRTTSTRCISRPSVNNDGNETDDSLDGYLTESTFEEIDYSDVESVATDSTIEDGWHNVSRDDN